MKQCSNCGAVLPEGEQGVCLICGTRQKQPSAQADAPVSAEAFSFKGARAPDTHADASPGASPDAYQDETPLFSDPDAFSHAYARKHEGRQSAPAAPRSRERASSDERSFGARGSGERAPEDDAAPHPRALHTAQSGRRTSERAETHSTATAKKPNRKPDNLLRILATVLAALVVLLGVGAGITYFMYEKFNPADAYSALTTALLKADVPALHELVDGEGIAVTDAGLAALCRAFATQEAVDRLLEQLKRQAAGNNEELPYPALAPSSDTVFLGYKSYKLLAKPVSLQITTVAQNTLLNLDGAPITGEPSAGGALYKGLFPGIYTCTVTGQTALGESVAGAPTDVPLFDSAAPAVFDGALPIATINVSGCLSDDAIIAVNGTDVAQKPSGKVVNLPQVSVGSTITMRYTTPYGATTTASVQFTDRAQTELAFTGHATEGGVPAEADLKSLFSGFYSSYLDALNNSDAARISACTEAMRSKLSGDVGKDEVKANLYVFTEANMSLNGLQQSFLEDATPTLKLNAVCTYTSTARATDTAKKKDDAKEVSHTVYYAAELAYVDGGWKVNRLAETTKENYDAGVLVPIEG